MTRVRVFANGSVDCRTSIEFSASAGWVWVRMRDIRHFATLDPFHERICLPPGEPACGAEIIIEHRFLGIRLGRVGRIMKWREGRCYAFTDLSTAGTKRGFPHAYEYSVEPKDESSSRISIRVRGKWTARWMPRWVVHLWLLWVMKQAELAVRNDLLWDLIEKKSNPSKKISTHNQD